MYLGSRQPDKSFDRSTGSSAFINYYEQKFTMSRIRRLFAVGYSIITILFVCCAICLIIFAVLELWYGINPRNALSVRVRLNSILESLGLLTVVVTALELGQTVFEQEVQREAHIS